MEFASIIQYNEWLNKHDKQIEEMLQSVDKETKFALIRIIQDISWALGYIDAICGLSPLVRFGYRKKHRELLCMIEASEVILLCYFKKAGES